MTMTVLKMLRLQRGREEKDPEGSRPPVADAASDPDSLFTQETLAGLPTDNTSISLWRSSLATRFYFPTCAEVLKNYCHQDLPLCNDQWDLLTIHLKSPDLWEENSEVHAFHRLSEFPQQNETCYLQS